MGSVIIKVSVLASGSKGNCSYISINSHKLLIDIGISCSRTETMLKSLKVNPLEIKSVIITHTHKDHIDGLKIFCKRYNPTVYLTKIMHQEIKNKIKIENYVYIENDFKIKDILISPIKTSHDTLESFGYLLESDGKNLVYITDTGYINKKYYPKLKNKDIYIMESNHDLEMLMKTNRPHYLKIRIIGDEGHLSNKAASLYLSEFVGPKTKHIVLAHLSEEANCPVIAKETITEVFKEKKIKVDSIIIANQKERTELIEI